LELPEQWLWDIIDEFIYQYQSFSVWRSKAASKTEEELTSLGDTGQVGPKTAIKRWDAEYSFH
jgi:translation initiation factor 3 subunit L